MPLLNAECQPVILKLHTGHNKGKKKVFVAVIFFDLNVNEFKSQQLRGWLKIWPPWFVILPAHLRDTRFKILSGKF